MKIKACIISLILNLTTANALILESLLSEGKLEETLGNKKIAYYIGSFDPLHLGHAQTAHEALNFEACDYVLIYPAWGGDDMKNRTDVHVRLEMLLAAFADDPHIIVTRLSPGELQNTLMTDNPDHTKVDGKSFVKSKITGTRYLGLIGSDTALGLAKDPKKRDAFMAGMKVPAKYAHQTIGGVIAIPVEGFIISLRNDDTIDHLEGKIGNRPISNSYSTCAPLTSSTKVREALKAGDSINDMVPDQVREIIEKYRLYRQ